MITTFLFLLDVSLTMSLTMTLSVITHESSHEQIMLFLVGMIVTSILWVMDMCLNNNSARGLPAEGLPVEGLPAEGLPAEGLPAEGLHRFAGVGR
jgi:hypothetical protein